MLFGHYLVLRGESRRVCELPDLGLLSFPSTEGASQCFGVAQTLTNGKTNKWGKKQFMGAMRHKDPLLCSMGALAQYLFWRWHTNREEPPCFDKRSSWYNTKLLVTTDPTTEMTWKTQYDDIIYAFGETGINSAHITHGGRISGAREAELHGCGEGQISRAGRWDRGAMAGAYLSNLPIKFLRKMAGFSSTEGGYFVARAEQPPPDVLLQQIFPWLSKWELKFLRAAKHKKSSQGGLGQIDLAGSGFLKLLKHLRTVLLQDLAIFQPGMRHLPPSLFALHYLDSKYFYHFF